MAHGVRFSRTTHVAGRQAYGACAAAASHRNLDPSGLLGCPSTGAILQRSFPKINTCAHAPSRASPGPTVTPMFSAFRIAIRDAEAQRGAEMPPGELKERLWAAEVMAPPRPRVNKRARDTELLAVAEVQAVEQRTNEAWERLQRVLRDGESERIKRHEKPTRSQSPSPSPSSEEVRCVDEPHLSCMHARRNRGIGRSFRVSGAPP